jgi:hypothetical protein
MTVSGPNGVVYNGYDCQTSGRGRSFRLRRAGRALRDQRADHDGRQRSLRRRSHGDDLGSQFDHARLRQRPGFDRSGLYRPIDGGEFVLSEGLVATPKPSSWAMLRICRAGFVVRRRARAAIPAA